MNRSAVNRRPGLPGTVALQLGVLALLCLFAGAGSVQAYERYDANRGEGCALCHDGFRRGNANVLHFAHSNNLGISECNFCHMNGGGSTPVYTYKSGAGGGYGCTGCHGQDYGEISPDGGRHKATGYGLRAFHAARGVTVCGDCHVPGAYGSPDPFPEMLPETAMPPYYGRPGSNLTDPCDSAQEDFTALGAEIIPDPVGLDNDGNGLADYPLDPSCAQLLLERICAGIPGCP